jgi:hypothetical protein
MNLAHQPGEQINQYEEASRRLENSVRKRDLVVISQDVKALYPSLDWEDVIEIVGKLIEETDVKFENMDYRVLGKYLAIHLTPEEITKNNLKTVIPKRVKSGGPTPGMAYLESDLDRNKQEKWSWKGKRKVPSSLQKKRMLARAMEVAVRVILSNHLYQFNGIVYRQQKGGPIGLELTGVLARMTMLWWDKAYKIKLKRLGGGNGDVQEICR